MVLVLAGIVIAVWLLFAGWKFYQTIDWEESPEPSPDLQGMRKRQAELLHIQDVLEEACTQGKLSRTVLEEFNRFCEAEIQSMQSIETAWKTRRASRRPPQT